MRLIKNFSKENDKKCNKSRNFVNNYRSYHKKTHYQQETSICWFSSIILPCFSFSDRRMQMSDLSLTTVEATTQMHPSHITSLFFDLSTVSPTLLTIFTTLEGTSAMLEGTSTQLLTTFGDTRHTKRKRAPYEAEARNSRHAPANAVCKSTSRTANRIKIIIKRIKRLYIKGIADTGRHQ